MWYELLTYGVLLISVFSLLVTLPAYLIVLVVIYRNRKVDPFNSEFFVIFSALGVVDIVCYFLYLCKKTFFLGYIPSVFEPFNAPNFLSSICYYPFWVFGFMQYQLMFILTLNRFISIVCPNFYTAYWRRGRSKWLVLLCFILCALLTSPILFANCQFGEYTAELDGINRTFYSAPMSTSVGIMNYITNIWSIQIYGLTFSCAIFYLIMLKTLRKNNSINNRTKLERQMFYVGFMLFVLNFFYTLYSYLRTTNFFTSSTQPHLHEWILLFISDIYDLPNGIMLLLTSSNIRSIISRGFKRQFSKHSNNSVSSTLAFGVTGKTATTIYIPSQNKLFMQQSQNPIRVN